MSQYLDTSSCAEDKLPSETSAPKEVHSPTESRETRGFLIKAYSLMYGSGLAWIAAIVAWAFTLVNVAAMLLLSLAWTATSAIGSRSDVPDLNIFYTVAILIVSTCLTALALGMTIGFRRMLNHSPTYGLSL